MADELPSDPPPLVPPPGFEAAELRIGREHYVLLSFPVRPPELPASLTAAEQEVVRRLLEGDKPAAIARARNTSIHTVNNQLRAIYAKLGVGSRAELARLCGFRAP